MGVIVAMHGQTTRIIIRGKSQEIIPFVGADRKGDFAQMGLGVLSADKKKSSIWGLLLPHALIQSWRGMRLLEHMQYIEHGTLCYCHTACKRNLSASDEESRDALAKQFKNRKEFDKILSSIMNSVPTPQDLETMIKILLENQVKVDGWDIKAEIDAGLIKITDQIQRIFDTEEKAREAYKKEQKECNHQLPRQESLSSFFEDLGIDNFIIGGGIGAYGIDWGHVKLKELDRIARQDSFSKYLKNGHKLEITTMSPETKIVGRGPGIEAYQTSFGNIEQPFHVTDDGTKYVFAYARWVDGKFYIKTIVWQNNEMVPPEAVEFTIQQLRELLGIVNGPLIKPSLIQQILSKLFG